MKPNTTAEMGATPTKYDKNTKPIIIPVVFQAFLSSRNFAVASPEICSVEIRFSCRGVIK